MAAKTSQGLFFYHGLWICRPGTGLDGLAAIYFTGYNVPIHPPYNGPPVRSRHLLKNQRV